MVFNSFNYCRRRSRYFYSLKNQYDRYPSTSCSLPFPSGHGSGFSAYCAFLAPESFHIGQPGAIATASLVEMSLGLIIGAITSQAQ